MESNYNLAAASASPMVASTLRSLSLGSPEMRCPRRLPVAAAAEMTGDGVDVDLRMFRAKTENDIVTRHKVLLKGY
jgi:hypothetical protein